jgi:hypothetical protein
MEMKMNNIKYTPEDIDHIFAERVDLSIREGDLKEGIIVEWIFRYPNGNKCAFVEASFPVNPDNFDYDVGVDVCTRKIKNKLWSMAKLPFSPSTCAW